MGRKGSKSLFFLSLRLHSPVVDAGEGRKEGLAVDRLTEAGAVRRVLLVAEAEQAWAERHERRVADPEAALAQDDARGVESQ